MFLPFFDSGILSTTWQIRKRCLKNGQTSSNAYTKTNKVLMNKTSTNSCPLLPACCAKVNLCSRSCHQSFNSIKFHATSEKVVKTVKLRGKQIAALSKFAWIIHRTLNFIPTHDIIYTHNYKYLCFRLQLPGYFGTKVLSTWLEGFHPHLIPINQL